MSTRRIVEHFDVIEDVGVDSCCGANEHTRTIDLDVEIIRMEVLLKQSPVL
jgi:hypothetical protein